TQFFLDLEDNSALRGAIQLGQYDARDINDLTEHACLHQAVLSHGRVNDEQDLINRGLLLNDALDLTELIHQVIGGMQAPGCINKHDIYLLLNALCHGIESDRGWVSTFFTAHGGRAYATSPGFELICSRRTESIRSAEQYRVAHRYQHARQ